MAAGAVALIALSSFAGYWLSQENSGGVVTQAELGSPSPGPVHRSMRLTQVFEEGQGHRKGQEQGGVRPDNGVKKRHRGWWGEAPSYPDRDRRSQTQSSLQTLLIQMSQRNPIHSLTRMEVRGETTEEEVATTGTVAAIVAGQSLAMTNRKSRLLHRPTRPSITFTTRVRRSHHHDEQFDCRGKRGPRIPLVD